MSFFQKHIHSGRTLLPAVLLLLTTSCSMLPTTPTPAPVETDTEETVEVPAYDAVLEALLADAARLPSPEAEGRYAEAADILLDRGYPDEAQTIISLIQTGNLPTELRTRVMLLQIEIYMANGRVSDTLPLLNSPELSSLPQFPPETRLRLRELRAQAFYDSGQYLLSAQERIFMNSQLSGLDQLTNHELIWQTLTELPVDELEALTRSSIAYEFQGWYELALLGKAYQFNMDRQQVELENWLGAWQRHPAATNLPSALQSLSALQQRRPEQIALLLPLQTTAGTVIQDSFMSAWYNAREIGIRVPEVVFYDTTNSNSIVEIHGQARAEGAELIIGPLLKPQVAQLTALSDLRVPTLALNTLDTGERTPARLYQFALSPENEVSQIISHAWEAGYRHAAILSPYESNPTNRSRKRELFTEQWNQQGGQIVSETLYTDNYTQSVENLLNISSSEARREAVSDLLGTSLQFTPRRRQDIDFILMIALPGAARQLNPSLSYYFAGDIPVLATQDIYTGQDQPQLDNDLNGIMFSDSPWLLTQQDELQTLSNTWFPQTTASLLRLQAFGIDAFRLHPRLSQLEDNEDAMMFGATGQLQMNRNRVISQTYNWARFEDGLARPE